MIRKMPVRSKHFFEIAMEFFNVPNRLGSSLNGRELIDFTNIFLISKIQLSYTPTVKKQFLIISINREVGWIERKVTAELMR
jgi:hypothetical protein